MILRHLQKPWIQFVYPCKRIMNPVRDILQWKYISVYSSLKLKLTFRLYQSNIKCKNFTMPRHFSMNFTSLDDSQIGDKSSHRQNEGKNYKADLNHDKNEDNQNVSKCEQQILDTSCDSQKESVVGNGELHSTKKLSSVEYSPDILTGMSDLQAPLPVRTESLAPYINDSITLQNLVTLGVDLSKISEYYPKVANVLLRMDFDTQMKPYLMFLYDYGVERYDLGTVINKNPSIFIEDIDNLVVRANYFKSMGFSKDATARIITVTPQVMSIPTVELDYQLAFVKKEFYLTKSEVIKVIAQFPQLIRCNRMQLTVKRGMFIKALGFTEWELKKMFLKSPKIITTGDHPLVERFYYLYNTMGLTHKDIVKWPNILHTRVFIVKQRHEFLKLIGRDQYDPDKENFVHLKRLVSHSDAVFCEEVAKVPLEQFNQYLKTL